IDEDALDDKEYTGSIISLLENAETFIKNNSITRWNIRGMNRIEESDYPQKAIREALVNAIIHRDYQITGSEIHVDLYDNRLEVSSPGGMMDGSKIQNMDLKHIHSMRRNLIISDLFGRLRFMERRGSGLNRIVNSYSNCIEKPRFYSEDNQFVVTLPNQNVGGRIESTVSEEDSILSEKDSIVSEEDSILSEQDSIVSEEDIIQVKKTASSKIKEQVEFETRIDAVLRDSTLVKTRTNTIKMFKKFGYGYSFNREKVGELFNVQNARASQIISLLIKNNIIERKQRDEYYFTKE
ncbi:MAG: transcriptional regulator, partial [Clostridiales bacterium]|nr:transcriptional regulator [Clostridiales bacterium]